MRAFKQPLTPAERLARMRENSTRFKGDRLLPKDPHGRSIAICGYGPSLARTWKDVSKCDEVMSTSGAHRFLLNKVVVPDFHVECDPRPHKAYFVRESHRNVTYLIASHCHPLVFEALRKRKVVLWHGFTDDDVVNQTRLVAECDGSGLIAGGTNVGMRAVIVALALGYRRLELHGMDCCYDGQTLWAGKHSGTPHHTVKVECAGRVFDTSDMMMQSTDDFFNLLPALQGCKVVIHGDGLLEERVKMYTKNPELALSPYWWKPVDFVVRRPPLGTK
jgi:uncharacterized Rossmann fold enzyme